MPFLWFLLLLLLLFYFILSCYFSYSIRSEHTLTNTTTTTTTTTMMMMMRSLFRSYYCVSWRAFSLSLQLSLMFFFLLLLMFFFLPSVISVENIAMLFVNLLSVFYWSYLVAKTFLLVLSRRLVYRAIKFDCNYSEDILGTNIRVGSGRERENNSCSNIWNNWCFYFEDRHVLFSRVVFTMVCNFICTSFTHYHWIFLLLLLKANNEL